jgi:hypothetical protein
MAACGDAAIALTLTWLTLTSSSSPGTPAKDAAVYLYQAVHNLQFGEIIWHGYYSSISLPHPGPILSWVLTIGQRFGGYDGAALAYTMTIATCIALAGRYVRHASGNWVGGAATVIAVLYLMRSVAANGTETMPIGIHVHPMYGPNFAAAIALAGIAAGVRCIHTKKGGIAAIVIGGLMVQASLETAPWGLLVAGVGVWCIWRGNGTTQRRVAAGAAGLLLGWAALLVRVSREGAGLPLRYAQAILTKIAEDDVATNGSEILRAAFGGKQGAIVILGAAAAGVVVLVVMRYLQVAALCALHIGSSVLISLYVVQYTHQAASSAAGAIIAVGLACGVGAEKLSGVRRGGLVNVVVGVVTLYSAGVSWLVWQTQDTYDTYLRTDAYDAIVETVQGGTGEVGIIATEQDLRLVEILGVIRPYELYTALEATGAAYCRMNQTYDDTLGPRSCQGRRPTRWLIVDTEARTGATYLYRSEADTAGGDREAVYIRYHGAEDLEEEGFTYCESSGMLWLYEAEGECP